MDKLDLSRKMKRLTAWLDTQNQPDGLAGRRFHGVPFADAYVTIDPERQSPYASANLNRVHLCGLEAGMSADGLKRLIAFFGDHGVQRFFVWLSPGPDMDKARGLLDQAGFSRIHWTGYPTLCRERPTPAHFRTDLDIRQVGPDDIAASREPLGETLWPEYVTSAGKDGFFHYMAFDGVRPVAIAALCIFEDVGYLMAAATTEGDRRRGAQQALIAKRVERAEQLGCAVLVSETLYMLEHSYRNLQRAGFEEVYEKEVYEWNA
jgi:GNAT superfamily N-acetyltransferase